jgi:hypothetical protein
MWARDLNCDGQLTIRERFEGGLDYGWRASVTGPPGCMEAFRYKDGIPDVLWCGDPLTCRRP